VTCENLEKGFFLILVAIFLFLKKTHENPPMEAKK
jgi:hypothetical protein